MNDQDIIQRNQILMMRALAYMMRHGDIDHPASDGLQYSNDLLEAITDTQKHLDWKLNKMSSAGLDDAGAATKNQPWPKDLGKEK